MEHATAADVLAGRSLYSAEQGDCLDFLQALPPDSVSLVVTSPPYDLARSYSVAFDKQGETWALWMQNVVVAALRVSPIVVCVCQGQTRDFAWTGSPVLLMANLLRAGVTLRRPVIYRRDSIPGSGGKDYLRMSWEFCIVATRGGKLPWADPTATGHPPKWGPGGEMSNRLANGARVNQWGHKAGQRSGAGTRNADGSVTNNGRPSHVETIIGPADDAPCLPGLEAPPPKPPRRVDAEGRTRTARKGFSVKAAHGCTMNDTIFSPPVIANPGDVVSHLYTQAEVDDLLAAYQGSDVVDVGVVGGNRMGSRLAHANEAPFPEDLACFFIKTFCPLGGVVLDCFAGSGTTLAVAVAEGRRALSNPTPATTWSAWRGDVSRVWCHPCRRRRIPHPSPSRARSQRSRAPPCSTVWRNRPMAERNCSVCDHFRHALGPKNPEGECHRHAPRPGDWRERATWPLVLVDDVCGEWRPLPVAQTPVPCARCQHLQGLVDSLKARVAEKEVTT
jgi:hypothetical protein